MHAAELGLVRTVQLLIEVGALTTVVDKVKRGGDGGRSPGDVTSGLCTAGDH